MGPLRPGARAKFFLKWGWAKTLGQWDAPVYIANVNNITPHYATEGTALTYNLQCSISGVNNDPSIAAPSDKNAGQMKFPPRLCARLGASCQQLAESLNWPIAAIEPSVEQGDIFQNGIQRTGESPEQFIKDRLVTIAMNAAKQGGYDFYFDFGSDPGGSQPGLHFHTPTYLSNPTVWSSDYIVYRDLAGQVISFTPKDSTYVVANLGGGEATHAGIDSKKGEPVLAFASATHGVPDEKGNYNGVPPGSTDDQLLTIFNPPQGPYEVHPGNPKVTAFKGWIGRTPADMTARATALFAALRLQNNTAELVVMGTHALQINSYMRVRYFTVASNAQSGPSGEHYLSGIFLVQHYTHTIDSNGWHTAIHLVRAGNRPSGSNDQEEVTVSKLTNAPAGNQQTFTLVPGNGS